MKLLSRKHVTRPILHIKVIMKLFSRSQVHYKTLTTIIVNNDKMFSSLGIGMHIFEPEGRNAWNKFCSER